MAMTGVSDIYRFEEVAAGETYTLNVSSKRYSFAPQVLNVIEEISDLDFRAHY
jgi:hypothetical protein